MTETQIETAQSAPETPAPVLQLSRHQVRIAKLQATLHARMTGKEPMKTEPRAVLFTSQLEKGVVALLVKCKNEGALDMVEPLKVALKYLSDVVTKIESSEHDRLRAATTIGWLAAQSLRAEIKLANNEVKKAVAGKSAAAAAARKAKHDAAKAGVVIAVAKARRKIDRQLRLATLEQESAAEIAKLEQAIKEAPDRFTRLLAKQALVKFKQELKKKGRK